MIGPQGSPSGCDDSHGGDGIVYYYKNCAEEPSNIKQYPNWQWVGYDLKDIADLFILAHKNWSCGQWEPYALFRCDAHGVPWDKFNAFADDAGDLPWAWGLTGVVDNAFERNMLINPGWIFRRYFYWPTGTFNSNSYINNWYSNYLIYN